MEISIKNLASIIKKFTGYNGSITWNKKMPDGQPRRRLDISKAKRLFGFTAEVNFEEGLKDTIDWYLPIWKKENGFSS